MNGYIALISVIIISAIALLIATSASLISISESDMALEENQSWESYYLANACVEDALMKLKDDLNYAGDEALNFDNGTCFIEPLEGIGTNSRIIKVYSNAYNQTRKTKIELDIVDSVIEIKSWQQVPVF